MGRQLTVVREDGNGWNAEHRSEPREASARANELARVGDDLRLNPEVHARRQYAAMRDALREIPTEQIVEHGNAGVAYLQSQPYVISDKVGAMGFCFGGSIVWRMAVGNPELRAAVPFYGGAPPLEDVPNLQVPVLGIYAGEDTRIGAGVPDLEAALKANGKNYKFVTYPGAGHAFFNDTGRRYHEQAAGQAWLETLGWFEDYLMDS